MSEHDEEVNQNLGISRRSLLRRGAVVGGTLMWTAPMVKSLTPAAFAQQGPSPGASACCYCWTEQGASGPFSSATRRAPMPGDVIAADECSDNGVQFERFSSDTCQRYCEDRGWQHYDYKSGPSEQCVCNTVPSANTTVTAPLQYGCQSC